MPRGWGCKWLIPKAGCWCSRSSFSISLPMLEAAAALWNQLQLNVLQAGHVPTLSSVLCSASSRTWVAAGSSVLCCPSQPGLTEQYNIMHAVRVTHALLLAAVQGCFA
jgi:hypothetical protein